MILGFIGVVLSLAFLIGLAYRGHSVIAIAPLAIIIAAIFSGAPLLGTYTQIFMPALGSFITNFFPLFLAGAIFGRLMTVSGYAEDLARWIPTIFGAKRAILVTTIITALLTYGGVSAWVIAFTIVPIAKPLFRYANVSMRLMPAAIALGIFTFATAALPGSPQIHNAIPTRFFGTTTFAAPLLGIIGALVTFGLGLAWLMFRERSLSAKGEGFEDISSITSDQEERLGVTSFDPATMSRAAITRRGFIGLLPVIVVVVMNAAFVYLISPRLNTSYLAEEKFGGTTLSAVLGVWSVAFALVVAGMLIFALQPRRYKEYAASLNEGARKAVLPAFTTASEVGYGAVIASLAVFAVFRDSLFNVSANPIVIGAVATALISGITGSSSGGLSITLQTFGEQLSQIAAQQGISAEFLHRAVAMASVSFDSLPHNGAIVTLLLVCGMTHRQAYKDIGVVTVLVPFIGLIAVMALGTVFPGLV